MKKAIDVVLLPSVEMKAQAIKISQELARSNDNKIMLGERCRPHISLCMGAIEEADLAQVRATLGIISENFSPFTLTVDRIQADPIPTGEKLLGFYFQEDEGLRRLHTSVMRGLLPNLSYDLDPNMFDQPSEIEDITMAWVNGFPGKLEDPTLFRPHITLGVGETDAYDSWLPIPFDAPTLAICQLGNYCTARNVLYEREL